MLLEAGISIHALTPFPTVQNLPAVWLRREVSCSGYHLLGSRQHLLCLCEEGNVFAFVIMGVYRNAV